MSSPAAITEASAAAEVIGQLDEDWAVPCTTDHQPPRDALWVATWSCPCPPGASVLCTGCKDAATGATLIVCETCRTRYSPGATAFRLIEPLNRRTT